jgi:RND superfamily putative drug exporter
MGLGVDLARKLVQHRRWVVVAWLAVAVLLLPASARVESALDVSARVQGSESARVEELLRTRFGSPFASYALLVVTGAPSPDDSEGEALLGDIVDSLERVPGVTRVLSYRDAPDTTFMGSDHRGTFLIVGLDPGGRPTDGLIPPLRAASSALEHRLRATLPRLRLRWTGEVPLNHDLRTTSAAEGRLAETRALPLTVALLLWAFGTLIAALLPVPAGLLSIGFALGLSVLLSPVLQLSILLQNVVTMLGLGLGIDYGLLTVSRFREALAAGRDPKAAAIETARHAGRTIALSGLAVTIGFAALLGIPLNELRSVAVGGLLVTALSVLAATSLLPAVLSWIGPGVNAWRVGWRRQNARSDRRWSTWGRFVSRHPWRVLLVAGTPVVALASQALRLNPELPRGNWLPPRMESAQGVDDLRAMGRSAVLQTVRVIVEFPAGVAVLDEHGWNALRRLADSLEAISEVAAVHSLPSLIGGAWSPDLVESISEETRRAAVSRDSRSTSVDIVPAEHADPAAIVRLVRRLRGADAAVLTGVPGTRLLVGGLPGFNLDYETAVAGRFPAVIVLVVGGTLLALMLGFRSLLIPLKAVGLNLLSVAAAFGALVLVFQDGHGARWLGVAGPMHGVFPLVPVLVFCTVFGLSMDYEVFLVARIAEARRRGCDEAGALAEGLARTGGVITSAAAIMVVVFAAFALGQFVLMKLLGFALAVAVVLDATVVRLAIGPALFTLAGKWNWWPGRIPVARGVTRAERAVPARSPAPLAVPRLRQ